MLSEYSVPGSDGDEMSTPLTPCLFNPLNDFSSGIIRRLDLNVDLEDRGVGCENTFRGLGLVSRLPGYGRPGAVGDHEVDRREV